MRYKFKNQYWNTVGFTIVELMLTLAILAIVLGSIWAIFKTQYHQINVGIETNLNIQDARSILKLLENDFYMASFGQDANLAFYVIDNSSKTDSWSDSLFFSDWQFLGGDEIKSSQRKINKAGQTNDQIGGFTQIVSGSGSQTITVKNLNLDNYGFGKHKLLFPTFKEMLGTTPAWANYDNCYGDHCTDLCQPNNGICSNDELAGGIWQTVISDAGIQKVAKINSISGNTLNLDRPISGTKLAPAIYYCLDEGSNAECDSNASTAFYFKRSDRTSGGRQPLASDIVDFQIAYQDINENWYCDETGPCPMIPFDPRKIKLVRISIISRHNASTLPAKVKKCQWIDQANSKCKSLDGFSTNATCISIENGPPWGCDCTTDLELKKTYFVSRYIIIPWNVIMGDFLAED